MPAIASKNNMSKHRLWSDCLSAKGQFLNAEVILYLLLNKRSNKRLLNCIILIACGKELPELEVLEALPPELEVLEALPPRIKKIR